MELQTELFTAEKFDLVDLAGRLTELKAFASRTPTPVTVEQLEAIASSPEICRLTLQLTPDRVVVGMVHLTIIPLEDRAHLGPICVQLSEPRGHGTPLMEVAIADIWKHFPNVRRIDLSNRPAHDLASWYEKFGFVARTEETGDPSTIYRLPRP